MNRNFLGGDTYHIVSEGGDIGTVITCDQFPEEKNLLIAWNGLVPVRKVCICDRKIDRDTDRSKRSKTEEPTHICVHLYAHQYNTHI